MVDTVPCHCDCWRGGRFTFLSNWQRGKLGWGFLCGGTSRQLIISWKQLFKLLSFHPKSWIRYYYWVWICSPLTSPCKQKNCNSTQTIAQRLDHSSLISQSPIADKNLLRFNQDNQPSTKHQIWRTSFVEVNSYLQEHSYTMAKSS